MAEGTTMTGSIGPGNASRRVDLAETLEANSRGIADAES